MMPEKRNIGEKKILKVQKAQKMWKEEATVTYGGGIFAEGRKKGQKQLASSRNKNGKRINTLGDLPGMFILMLKHAICLIRCKFHLGFFLRFKQFKPEDDMF